MLLRKEGLLNGSPDHPKGDVWVVPEGGTAAVYVTKADRRAELVPKLRRLLAGAEGIEHIYGDEDFAALGLPSRSTSDQAPDLVLAARPDYALGGEADGSYLTQGNEVETHGYVNSDTQDASDLPRLGRRHTETGSVRKHYESQTWLPPSLRS